LNNQLKSIGLLFSGQVLIKSSNFLKQLLMAYFLGVSGRVDLLLVAQIIPNIIGSMISGGAGEILVTKTKVEDSSKQTFVTFFTFISTALIAIVLFLYWFFLPFVADKLDVSLSDQSLFTQLSFLLIVGNYCYSTICKRESYFGICIWNFGFYCCNCDLVCNNSSPTIKTIV
jgi:peptidoglycan biosynthesis protein MviN/MurJ (putative lipid II flippase)